MSKQADPREAYIAASPSRVARPTPREVVEDLRYFRKRHDEGSSISIKGLLEYFERERQFTVRRQRLHTIAAENGVTPWWSSK